jgi:putative ATP-binding cassette transporter
MFVAVVITGLFSGAMGVAPITLIAKVLNGSQASPKVLLWILVILGVVQLVSRMASRFCVMLLSRRTTQELRNRMARQILSAPLPDLETIGIPRLLGTLRDDVDAISHAFTQIPRVCADAAIVIGGLAYLGWLSLPLLAVALGLLSVGVIIYHVVMKRTVRTKRRSREELDKLSEHFLALTEGVKELKLYSGRREAFLGQICRSSLSHYESLAHATLRTTTSGFGRLLYFVCIGVALFALPADQAFNKEILTGYALMILFMVAPIRTMMESMPVHTNARIAMERVGALGLKLEEFSHEESITDLQNPDLSWNRLEFVGVAYTYRSEQEINGFTFGPIDLIFRPAELVFVIGGNGSGKTTFVKLLTGLYVPDVGEIRMNGTPVNRGNLEWYRRYVSAVFSDCYLFRDLAGANIPDLESKVQRYLVQLQLDGKVHIRNGVFSTTVALSRGQRKRLALLIACVEDRPIYVFDEWASDQDPVFKRIFYTEILSELKAKGKTVVAITHDESYYFMADRLVKLDYGQLECDRRITKPADKCEIERTM